jgi:predicted DNA-binding transcriptional regulator AlpA
MSALGRALLDDLGPDELADLADKLAPYLRLAAETPDGWLDTKAAAEHLGVSVNALYRLVRERRVPFSQSAPNAKLWFRRSELDEYRSEG